MAVADSPAASTVPSARSTPLLAPTRPETPNGGLETVTDREAADLVPLLVSLIFSSLVCCSTTLPNVKGGLLLV